MKTIALLMLAVVCWLPLPAQAAASHGEVLVYNWSEYIPQSVLNDFTKETGIKVIYSTFESNEQMYDKVKMLGGKGYDVVVPSNYFLDLMRHEKLLSRLDLSKIPNLKNLDAKMLSQPYDPANHYSVPYMWGATGLAYNRKYVKAEDALKWEDLLRPQFKGKIILSDDLRDSFSIALKALGFSANSTHQKEIEQAYQFLRQLKPSVRIFNVSATKQALIDEEVWLGPIWNGDFLVAKEENDDLEFVFPEEGAMLWVDSFVILQGARNIDNAHTFINYMLRPDVAKRCIEEYLYSSPNLAGLALLDEQLRTNPVLVPTEKELNRAELQTGVGNFLAIYEKYWEKLKTGD